MTSSGDLDPGAFRAEAHRLVDWISRYLEGAERYPVLSRVRPGEIRDALPAAPPPRGEPLEAILADVERVVVPGLTHWNHPRFFAYFANSSPGPAVLAEAHDLIRRSHHDYRAHFPELARRLEPALGGESLDEKPRAAIRRRSR